MTKRPIWSTPLSRPIVIPGVMKIKTLADVRKLLGHIPEGTPAELSILAAEPKRPTATAR